MNFIVLERVITRALKRSMPINFDLVRIIEPLDVSSASYGHGARTMIVFSDHHHVPVVETMSEIVHFITHGTKTPGGFK